jgi:hypothetical protein
LAQTPVDRLAGNLPPGATHEMLEITAHRQHYLLHLPAPATVTLALHEFPGWRATVNSAPAPIRAQAETGLITLDLPAGDVDLLLTFGPTPLRQAMQRLSALAWVGLGVGVVLMGLRRRKFAQRDPGAAAGWGVVLPVAGVVLAVWGMQLWGGRIFQLHSSPDQALPAALPLQVDFGTQVRLLGLDPLPETVRAGDTLDVVAYWRALDDSDENYSVVLHLVDLADGVAVATLRQLHPSDIPTSGWATGLYVRNALSLPLPTDLLPVQYGVRVGIYDAAQARYLPTAQGDLWEAGRVWVLPHQRPEPPAGPQARFGEALHLLGVEQSPAALTLYWRSDAPLPAGLSIFVHLLDADGQLIGQLDGVPYAGRYALDAWRPGQVIEDRRDLADAGIDPAQVSTVAVGVYSVADGVRLPALDAGGARLTDDALRLPWGP